MSSVIINQISKYRENYSKDKSHFNFGNVWSLAEFTCMKYVNIFLNSVEN